jgi:hypothetical protein
MHNIETNPSWLFSQSKYKGIASFSPFTLTSTPLLTIDWTMSTYPHEA